LGVVGESGCGKSTLARCGAATLAQVGRPGGVAGPRLGCRAQSEIRKLRGDFQIVFQDPLASLDPRMPIGISIAEPLKALEPNLSRETLRQKCAQ
jgi:ABC-type microcin C transport system duplicated ATPase subunit YejF